LYRGDGGALASSTKAWPDDIRGYFERLLAPPAEPKPRQPALN
jgi:hypothetical protein